MDIVAHDNPVRRPFPSIMVRAALHDADPDSDDPQFEQLWTERLSESTVKLACIPLFVYGMAFNDVLEISPRFDVIGVRRWAGHRALRVAAEGTSDGARLLLELGLLVPELGLVCEIHGGGYAAIDIPPGKDDVLAGLVQKLREMDFGLQYEIVP